MAEEDLDLICALPNENHAKLVMHWRNNPETLANSLHSRPKTWPDFWKEYLDYFNFPELPPLFISLKGEKVGFIKQNFVLHPKRYNRKCVEVSINLKSEARGRGIGSKALLLLKELHSNQVFDDLYAEIKPHNQASHQAFLKAGFTFAGTSQKRIEIQDIPVNFYLLPLTADQKDLSVFVIAEAGSNWRMGSLKRDIQMAKALIYSAAEASADAIKFQTFKPETTYSKFAGQSSYLQEAGIKEDITEIFSDLAMPYEMLEIIARECASVKIEFMPTPFSPADFKAVDPFVKRHKIASYEIGHIHLLELAAKSQKPLILSTGASIEEEIAWAVRVFKDNGGKDLTLLQCTAAYPAQPASLHLRTLSWLQKRFKTAVGLSDHSLHPIYAPVAAVSLGAKVIEKHFTLNRKLPGPDHAFAITTEELKEMVQAIRQAEELLGSSVKCIDDTEQELCLFAKRGIQALKAINPGEILIEGENISILRPGLQNKGLHPMYLKELNGKKAARAIKEGEGIQPGDWK